MVLTIIKSIFFIGVNGFIERLKVVNYIHKKSHTKRVAFIFLRIE